MKRRLSLGLRAYLLITLLVSARAVSAQAHIVFEPRQPAAGALIRVTIDGLVGNADSAVSAVGVMAGEPLHFRAASKGRLQALGAIPVDASDSVLAHVSIERRSGIVDTLRAV